MSILRKFVSKNSEITPSTKHSTPDLTIFACPKAFTDPHIAVIQQNAISSWMQLYPRPEIILFGDEEGTAEICQKLGLHHVYEIARNEFGTPLLNDIFEKAQQLANYDLMCYVNADMILMSNFSRAIEELRRFNHPFLMSSGRWNLYIKEFLDFAEPYWEELLMEMVMQQGVFNFYGNDFFVFPRGFYRGIPPLAIGRPWFDSWLFWKALSLKAAVIDASSLIIVVHQNHNFSHVKTANYLGSYLDLYNTVEAKRNFELAEGAQHWVLLNRATHILTSHGVKKVWQWSRKMRFRFKSAVGKTIIYRLIVYWLGPIRHTLGLRRSNFRRIKYFLVPSNFRNKSSVRLFKNRR